ncbi:MAG TPA: ATP-binding protein [Anaerolineales bacterium]|nr:ATP-binding protein [Anaerolineales bacterium]
MPKLDLILIALETSTTSKLMERALSAHYQTAIATDVKSLNRLLQESTPALLLVGERFDGQDGIHIAEEVLERFPTLPFLIYADRAKPELIKSIFRIGVSGFLSPPLKTDEIVDIVENSLKHAHRIGDWLRREVKRTTSSLKKRAQISEAERARLETIFNSIHDSVMILDEDNLIVLVNPAMCLTFGLSAEDAIGEAVLDVLTQPDLVALLKQPPVQNALRYHEISFPDGRVGSAQLIPIPEIGFALTMFDITDLKEMDRIRSELVHTVSHDLRSPLTSVIGYTELIERAGALNDSQREFLKRIQESVQHITSLINDLLELGSVEAGLDTRREYVQLDGILNYTLEMLQGQIKAKHIRVQTEVPEALPALRANPVRLRQVLDNVVGNAIKYSSDQGEVSISMRSEDSQVIVQVTDNGPGIPVKDQAHIFDKFYRGSNISSHAGSGLGLAIVKSIVEAHQGRMWVESTVGRGSSFFIVLPLLTDPPQIAKK